MKKNTYKRSILLLLLIISAGKIRAQSLSEKVAKTAMNIWPDTSSVLFTNRAYDQGVLLEGMAGVWKRTANADYYRYIQKSMNKLVDKDGNIASYKSQDFNMDPIKNGRALLLLYRVTGQEKYYKALRHLREQLKTQPRTLDGGFWHEKNYPNQMWLDDLYMGEPFYAEYAATFDEPSDFDDIAKQFILIEKHARDPKTGLLYHGWDESKQQKWANKITGQSPNFWGKAMGWYGMALVDVLEYLPETHPQRKELLAVLNRFAVAVQKYEDPKTGVWYQVLDKGNEKGNYLESSASSMFVYTLAKGTRLGYLPEKYKVIAKKGYNGTVKQFIETDASGNTNLKGSVVVAGLGGNPYGDGSYAYYVGEKVITNHPTGVGAFLQAANEIELAKIPQTGKGQTVMLDSYFNNEFTKDITGRLIPFHYKWDEMDNNGFYFFKNAFNYHGVKTAMLHEAPTAVNLKGSNMYIIVDPDTQKETEKPNYVNQQDAKTIANWVKAGGVLVILANDAGNCDLEHLNILTEKFGIHFNEDSRNKVTTDLTTGDFQLPANDPIFKTGKKVHIKEISTLKVTPPAVASFTDGKDVIIATAKYGKGAVFAVGDPWFYNEYTDGRKIPVDYQNFEACNDLVNWLIKQVPAKTN
ncbi:MAG: glycoside hydrolase family 88 protein [Janthinobacterium lividum]